MLDRDSVGSGRRQRFLNPEVSKDRGSDSIGDGSNLKLGLGVRYIDFWAMDQLPSANRDSNICVHILCENAIGYRFDIRFGFGFETLNQKQIRTNQFGFQLKLFSFFFNKKYQIETKKIKPNRIVHQL